MHRLKLCNFRHILVGKWSSLSLPPLAGLATTQRVSMFTRPLLQGRLDRVVASQLLVFCCLSLTSPRWWHHVLSLDSKEGSVGNRIPLARQKTQAAQTNAVVNPRFQRLKLKALSIGRFSLANSNQRLQSLST